MGNKYLYILFFFTALLFSCGGGGGDDDDSPITPVTPPTVPVASVSISLSSLTMEVGEKKNLTAVVSPSDATNKTVTWRSSNVGVASVSSDGEVTGIGAGKATITAAADGKSATCEVTVSQESGGINVDINGWNNGEDFKGNVD